MGQFARGGFAFCIGTGEIIVTGPVDMPSALASASDTNFRYFSSVGFVGAPSSAEDGLGVPLEVDEASDPPEIFFAMLVLRFSQVLRSARAGKLD